MGNFTNVEYAWMEHPRFGNIGYYVAIKRIHKGEEILADYLYPKSIEDLYPWYKELVKMRGIKDPSLESKRVEHG